MQRRDYLMAQIEQLGKVLVAILTGFKESENDSFETAMSNANNEFIKQTNIDFDKILELEKDDLKEYLQDKVLAAQHIDILGDYLLELANSTSNNKIKYLEKILELYQISDEMFQTISFGGIQKYNDLKNRIEKLNTK